ncbi:MAG: aldose 1-epimerase family protein [Ruminococcaceae bacterium]|nr:aldose 1-epimerase family protein [Oscillospiraceae bacterium]
MEFTLIKNGNIATVTTAGGELISFVHNGREYLWNGDPEFWPGHAPVLFPFVSALNNSTVSIEGKPCTLNDKHGFGRKFDYVCESVGEDEVCFLLKENEVTLKQYPYRFELRIIHKMTDCGFSTTYEVKNTDNKNIIFCIGGHPGFAIHGDIADYTFKFNKEESADLYYTDENSHFSYGYKWHKSLTGRELNLTYSDFDRDALLTVGLNSNAVTVTPADGVGAFEFGFEGYPVLAIWTPPFKKAPFVCLEPWHGLPALTDESGKFEDKPFAVTLDPGETKSLTYSFKAL